MSVPTINEHISTIYRDHEQSPEATIRKFLIVQSESIRQVELLVDFYSLDMILAISYRVRSLRGVQFRRGATERPKEYMGSCFALILFFKNYLIITTLRRSIIAPTNPTIVMTVSGFISGLCTGQSLVQTRINRFPEAGLRAEAHHHLARTKGIMSRMVMARIAAIQYIGLL